jgi:hypothetical protein
LNLTEARERTARQHKVSISMIRRAAQTSR